LRPAQVPRPVRLLSGHELTCETLRRVWDEVREFWQGRDMTRLTSSFLN
jgi:hypothetical protein